MGARSAPAATRRRASTARRPTSAPAAATATRKLALSRLPRDVLERVAGMLAPADAASMRATARVGAQAVRDAYRRRMRQYAARGVSSYFRSHSLQSQLGKVPLAEAIFLRDRARVRSAEFSASSADGLTAVRASAVVEFMLERRFPYLGQHTALLEPRRPFAATFLGVAAALEPDVAALRKKTVLRHVGGLRGAIRTLVDLASPAGVTDSAPWREYVDACVPAIDRLVSALGDDLSASSRARVNLEAMRSLLRELPDDRNESLAAAVIDAFVRRKMVDARAVDAASSASASPRSRSRSA